jgi:chemotaxis protein MotA
MASAKKTSAKPDLASFGGVVVGLVSILGGLILEGGKLQDVSQITAAIIVLGGTLGATMLTAPLSTLIGAIKRLYHVFFEEVQDLNQVVDQIIALAVKARKSRLVSLEQDVEQLSDPFLKKALSLAVDGTDIQEIRKMMELEMAQEEHHIEAEAKVYETAGGFAPTIGIIGAVLGLIQVMKHLENIEEVGHGIAVAFVATVYGVAAANLFFLPAAGKIKARVSRSMQAKELMLEGVTSIVEGMNPKVIKTKLEAFLHAQAPGKKKKADAPAAAQTVSAES